MPEVWQKKMRGRESLFGACSVGLAARDVEGRWKRCWDDSGAGSWNGQAMLAKAVPSERHMAKRRERRVSWRSEW